MNAKKIFIGAAASLVALTTFIVLAGPNDPIPLSGYVAVKNGGTGTQTLSGLLKGNGTSAVSTATGSDITGSFTGTCNSSTWVRGDGSCQTQTGASLSATQTWTGLNTYDGNGSLFGSAQILSNSGAVSDRKNWLWTPTVTGTISLNTATDAAPDTPVNAALTITRTGTTVGTITLASGNSDVRLNPSTSGKVTISGLTIKGYVSALKSTPTSRTSSTSLVIDPDLQLALPVSTNGWELETCLMFFGSTTGTQGINFKVSQSAVGSSVGSLTGGGWVNNASTGFGVLARIENPQTGTGAVSYSTISTTSGADSVCFHGFISGSGSGTIGIFWGQNSSSANATTMLAGSYIRAWQL